MSFALWPALAVLCAWIVFAGEPAASPAAKAPAETPAASGAKPQSPPPVVVNAADYPNLQAALDAVPAGGGLVKLPPGSFEIDAPLVVTREDTRIEGAGTATQIVNRNQEGQPAMIIRAEEKKGVVNRRVWRVQVADFRIRGNPKSGDGLLAQGVNELYVDGLAVDHNGGHGISLVDCYEDPRVCNSIVTYNGGNGVNILRSHDIVVSANQLEENRDAVCCVDSFNLCMTGNNLDDHLGRGVVIENTYGSVLSGNMIEECQGAAVVLDRDCYGITVSANVLAHNRHGGVLVVDGWGCAISANTLTIDATRGVEVGPDAGRITITGNSFSNAYIGGKTKRDDAATGVLLRGTTDVAVSGNVFSGLQGAAVRGDRACRRISVTGNVMTEVNLGGPPNRPAIDLGGAQETMVRQNLLPSDTFVRERTP